MTVDIVLLHPRETIYPAFYEVWHKNKQHFNRLLLQFTNDHVTGKDYSSTALGMLTWEPNGRHNQITALQYPTDSWWEGDWRNIATNNAIDKSLADYILFMEPDFLIRDLGFVKDFTGDVLGVDIDGRLHPCFLLVKRSILEKTSRDFTAYPDQGMDHFGKIQQDLEKIATVELINDKPIYWHHMAGLTHNMRLEAAGEPVVYKPDEYRLYKILESLL